MRQLAAVLILFKSPNAVNSWKVQRCTAAWGEEIIFNQCIEAEFITSTRGTKAWEAWKRCEGALNPR